MLVDSHCHLNYPGLRDDQAGVIERARAAGVGTMLGISTRAAEWDEVIGLAATHDDIWASVGVHPHEADKHPDIDAARLIDVAAHARVVAIGETGLDYHYDHSDRQCQRASFRAHIAAARTTGLPLIVHTRDAEADTAAILADEMGQGSFGGVIHCFTASASFAEQALALGFSISFSGIVTFRNARDVQAVASVIPFDRLLIETDSPFLAPIPMRGRPCEPAYIVHTAARLAELRGVSADVIADTTADNFFALFAKARRPCG